GDPLIHWWYLCRCDAGPHNCSEGQRVTEFMEGEQDDDNKDRSIGVRQNRVSARVKDAADYGHQRLAPRALQQTSLQPDTASPPASGKRGRASREKGCSVSDERATGSVTRQKRQKYCCQPSFAGSCLRRLPNGHSLGVKRKESTREQETQPAKGDLLGLLRDRRWLYHLWLCHQDGPVCARD